MEHGKDIFLIRHTDHGPRNFVPGLTQVGYNEAVAIGHSLPNDIEIAYTPLTPHQRHLSTVALALYPDTPPETISDLSSNLIAANKIVIDNDLNYLPLDMSTDFGQSMLEASNNGRGLEFLVTKSDAYLGKYVNISTYKTMSQKLAEKLLTIQNMSYLICTREYMIASLRARIIQEKIGKRAVSDYIEYYNHNEESIASARMNITHISTHDDEQYAIEDGFGITEFDKNILDKIRIVK